MTLLRLPGATGPVGQTRPVAWDRELFAVVVSSYVGNLRAEGASAVLDATVTPAMVEELWEQFRAAGGTTARRTYDRMAVHVRERLRGEIIREMWGEEAALRVELSDDRYVTSALEAAAASRKVRR